MSANAYLILGVNPANNEKDVATNSTIVINFAADMDQSTLTSSNLVLRKVNGSNVTCTISYYAPRREATLTPSFPLEAGTNYELQIVGGESGVKTILGEYLPETKYYEFTTAYSVLLSEPTSLSVAVSSGYPTVSWSQPSAYDPNLTLTYEVKIGTTSVESDPPIWPSSGDLNTTTSTSLDVPKKLSDGNYYAYVRATTIDSQGPWASFQFLVSTETVTDPSSSGFTFEVMETYPKADSVDINPDKIHILFTSNINVTSITSSTVYVVKKVRPKTLTAIDFLTEFSPSKQIPVTIDALVAPTNLVTLTPADGAIENDSEYTVVVRESVKSDTGETLGIAYSWSFLSEFTYLYGNPESIRDDIGAYVRNLTDKVLYRYMSDVSQYAYSIVSQTSNFNAADYENGKAPFYVHQYVRYQTAYDLLLNAYLHQSSGTGNSVRLGDLQIDKSANTSDITGLLRNFKDRIKPWLDALHGHSNRGYAKPAVAVKGENGAPYPDFLTRAELRELGE